MDTTTRESFEEMMSKMKLIEVPLYSKKPPEKTDDDNSVERKVETRKTFLKLGVKQTVNASAYLEYGGTKVLTIVQLPRRMKSKRNKRAALKLPKVVLTVKYAPFAIENAERTARKENHIAGVVRRTLERLIHYEQFANFQVEVDVLVVDDDGCVLSTAINCAAAAVIEGGIPVYGVLSAATVCIHNGQDYINPTCDDEVAIERLTNEDTEEDNGTVTIAYSESFNQVYECVQTGTLKVETFQRLLQKAIAVADRFSQFIRDTLYERIIEKKNQNKNAFLNSSHPEDNEGFDDDEVNLNSSET